MIDHSHPCCDSENAKLRAALDKAEAAEDLRALCSDLDAKLRASDLQVRELIGKLKAISDIPEGRREIDGESWPCAQCVEKTVLALFFEKQVSAKCPRCDTMPIAHSGMCEECYEMMVREGGT